MILDASGQAFFDVGHKEGFAWRLLHHDRRTLRCVHTAHHERSIRIPVISRLLAAGPSHKIRRIFCLAAAELFFAIGDEGPMQHQPLFIELGPQSLLESTVVRLEFPLMAFVEVSLFGF